MANEFEKNKTRQGRRGMPVLVVLLTALVLAAVVWIGVEMYGEQIEPAPEESIESGTASPPAPPPATPGGTTGN